MRFFARILSVFLLGIIFANIFSLPVFAAETQNTVSSPMMPNTAPGVPQDVGTLTQGILMSMLSFTTCALAGINVIQDNNKCLGYNKDGQIGYVENSTGMFGILSGGIALTFTKPMGTSDYLHYLSSSFGLTKHAYAAEDGFAQLQPLTTAWLGMRNFAYILFVIIFVVIGFAIMLRAKIDPRTVMTVENQIPKLIVALILISFSFAIAGLAVDVMWLLIFVTVNLLSSLDPSGLGSRINGITQAVGDSPLSLANSVSGGGGFLGIAGQAAHGTYDIANQIILSFIGGLPSGLKVVLAMIGAFPSVVGCLIQGINPVNVVTSWWNSITGGGNTHSSFIDCITSDQGIASFYAGLGAAIAFIIFTIALIIAIAKLWWTLIKSYALFVIYVILAPVMIMAGVLPGSKINFENWFRHILAYLFVFPTAAGILLLGKVVMDAYNGNTSTVPPLLGVPQGASGALGVLLGFAIIMLLPQSLTIVQDALQAPDIKYLSGIGAMLGAGAAGYTSLVSKPWQMATRRENRLEGKSEGFLRKGFMNIKLPRIPGTQGAWNVRRLMGEHEVKGD